MVTQWSPVFEFAASIGLPPEGPFPFVLADASNDGQNLTALVTVANAAGGETFGEWEGIAEMPYLQVQFCSGETFDSATDESAFGAVKIGGEPLAGEQGVNVEPTPDLFLSDMMPVFVRARMTSDPDDVN